MIASTDELCDDTDHEQSRRIAELTQLWVSRLIPPGECLRKFQRLITSDDQMSELSSLEEAEARADEFKASWSLAVGYAEVGSSVAAQVYGNEFLYNIVLGLRALFSVSLSSRRHQFDPHVLFWWPGSMCEPRRRGKWKMPLRRLTHSKQWKRAREALDDCRVRRGVVL